MKKSAKNSFVKAYPRLWLFLKWFVFPGLVYFVVFCLFTWPWISHFGSFFYADQGDGSQNVWNMWWIHKAVVQLHQSPWHTSFLHYPFGVTLVGQTLNPFNGFVALGLLPFIKLNQAYNIMVIFSFVMGGVAAFWLCYHFAKSYVSSLVGGAIFTFSSYHFAHAEGHMQLVSLEWMPLFMLLWWKFLKKPSYWLAAGVSVSLLLTLLCDYYYFLYSVIFAGCAALYFIYKKEFPNLKERVVQKPVALLLALSAILVAPLPIALLYTNSHTSFEGSHPVLMFSTDILTPFIDGGFWRFHSITNGYWRFIQANYYEATVYLTISVLVLLVISLFKRKKLNKDLLFWQLLIVGFGIMSLGPRLLVRGHTFMRIRLPYIIMERLIPGMKLSGMPVRMMVMVILGSAVIAAVVLAKLDLSKRKGQVVMVLFIAALLFELWPNQLPLSTSKYQAYVYKLQSLPATGGVLDEAAVSEPIQLYNQTLHSKPMPFGYISRKPTYLNNLEFPLYADNTESKLDLFCKDFKIRYLTTPTSRPRNTTFPVIYQDSEAIIYDLKDSPNC